MRALLLATAYLLTIFQVTGQGPAHSGRVNERIAALKTQGVRFVPVTLLDRMASTPETDALWMEACTRADVLLFQQTAAAAVLADAPEHISLVVPASDGTYVVDLELTDITTDDFVLNIEGSGPSELPKGLHYRGSIQGHAGSIAAISIYENEVMGILSDASGERIIGRFDNAPVGTHVFYHEDDLRGQNNAVCSTTDDGAEPYREEDLIPTGERTTRCVRFYWEIAYDIVQNKGSVTNATNYALGLFNQSGILFDNDGIDVILSELFVWSGTSPYNATSSSGRLNQFGTTRTSFNGDLAHLIDLGNYGGVAWLNTLCSSTSYRMAYSGINSSYSNVPTYSWSVEVVTHEQGHNLGSKHTHACAWNGNNTAIDGCGQSAGYSEGSCSTGPIPTSAVGGTIMSYCHLTSTTIKFANGFGPQPTALITNRVNSSTCLLTCGTTCNAPVVSATATSNSGTISWTNVGATDYTLQWKLSTSGTWTTVNGLTGTSHQLTGLAQGTAYNYRIMANCGTDSSAWSDTGTVTTTAPCVDNFEPNNTLVSATDISIPVALNALIGGSSDVDYYRITLGQNASLSISLSNLAGDYDLRLLNSAGTQLAVSQNGGTSPESISYSATQGIYYIHIYGYNGAFSASQCYLLNVSASGAQGCPVPAGLSATNITTTAATISWSSAQSAVSYDLQWQMQGDASWNTISGITGTSHILTGLTPGTPYSTRVRSNCTGGASLYSSAILFTTVNDPCSAGVRLGVQLWLDGAYVEAQQLMRDDLRAQGLIPLTEPYSALGFVVGGVLFTTPAVLSISGNNAVVDWVLIEVRSSGNSSQVLASRAGLLRRDGTVTDADGVSSQINFCLPSGSYFVSVRHRNHLGCMTSTAVPLSSAGSIVDLRTTATATFGSGGRRSENGTTRLWAGNTNGDLMVKYTGSTNDRDLILTATGGIIPTNTITGYHMADVNLDGIVKYTGSGNDRDVILTTIGGVVPTNTRTEQVP